MLMKKQLKDAAKCDATCQNCSLIRVGEYKSDCIPEIAKTALAYREMLERHFIEEGHYSSLEELAEVEELLKESEGVSHEIPYK